MNKKQIVSRLARVGLISFSLHLLSMHLHAQDASPIFVLPAHTPEIGVQKSLEIARELSAYIVTRNEFVESKTDSINPFLAGDSIKLAHDDGELQTLGARIGADFLFIPVVQKNENSAEFKVSIFDVKIGFITKVVVQNCDCDSENISGFPFRKIVELLFEAPDLELVGESSQTDPPSMLPEMPAILTLSDTSNVATDTAGLSESTKRKRSWKKYVASAVVAGGGVLYLTVIKKSDKGGSGVKLDDPPDPPGSN
ncbi:MAG: hypothetical protein DWQ05_04040 [Calditrichaeota bacterium]|nr:MAG: hypothetical protein DWQ05_04040 [Calditrichota bacterium]